MGIQKPFLESFSTEDLIQFIDHYAAQEEVLYVQGHPWESCDQLAWFLGFGYDFQADVHPVL